MTAEGTEFRWNAADFRESLKAPRPAGCQSSVAFIRKIVEGMDVAGPFEDLIGGERGTPVNDVHNPAG